MSEDNLTQDNINWETSCPDSEDGIHCYCWYDGAECCACERNK